MVFYSLWDITILYFYTICLVHVWTYKISKFFSQNNEKGGASLSSFTLKFKSEKVTVILFISLFAFLYAGIETNLANFYLQ